MEKHVLVALVENKAGVLNKIASLFRRKRYNIDSLTVGRTKDEDISRMTIVCSGDVKQIMKQMYKVIEVIKVGSVCEDNAYIMETIMVIMKNEDGVMNAIKEHDIQILDKNDEIIAMEITDSPDNIDGAIDALNKFEIIKMTRGGTIAMCKYPETTDVNILE